jgi:hypothetical protein
MEKKIQKHSRRRRWFPGRKTVEWNQLRCKQDNIMWILKGF